MLLAITSASAGTQYPQNPCHLKQYLYTGEAGLKKFDLTAQAYVWSVLPQHSTFEPVCTAQRIFIGSHNGLYAINSSSGKVLWSIGQGITLFSPVVDGQFVYVTGLDGKVRKLQTDSGKLIWQKQLKGWLYPPVVMNGRVIVGGNGRTLYTLDANNGTLLWKRDVGQQLVYRPVAAKPAVIVVPTYGPQVMAINVKTNKILWSKKDASTPYTATIDNDQLFYGDQNGILHAVNVANGKENWHVQLLGVIRSSPTVNKNTIWIGTERGQLTALNKMNGKILWQKQLKQSLLYSPMPVANKVYLKVDSRNLLSESFSLPIAATDKALPIP